MSRWDDIVDSDWVYWIGYVCLLLAAVFPLVVLVYAFWQAATA